jgi:uncharacterized membrane protein
MSELAIPRSGASIPADVWAWWQERRLGYNIALAAAGMAAYLLSVGLHYVFGDPVWAVWQDALGFTLFLGTAYLVLMGVANICYLIGPFGEAWLKPADVEGFRRTAYRMGLWGSVALPFVWTLFQLSFLIES